MMIMMYTLPMRISDEWEETMRKIYHVTLTDDERTQLHDLIKKGQTAARRITRAHILLHADEGRSDTLIAEALHVGRATVERVRKRFVEGNLERALTDAPRPGAGAKLDGKQQAFVIATACSTPPKGRTRWTLRLLAERMVALEQVDTLSHETVRRVLKKVT
jgi:transposase